MIRGVLWWHDPLREVYPILQNPNAPFPTGTAEMPEIGVLAFLNNGMLGGQTVDSTMMPPTPPTSLSVPNHCESASAPQGLTVAGIAVDDATLRRIDSVCDQVG